MTQQVRLLAPTTRVGNYEQILEETVIVSGTLKRSVNAAGVGMYVIKLLSLDTKLKACLEVCINSNQKGKLSERWLQVAGRSNGLAFAFHG